MAGRRLGGLLKALNSLDLGSVPGAVTALLTPALGRGTGLLAAWGVTASRPARRGRSASAGSRAEQTAERGNP